jgi:hypothetical protein
MAPTSRVGGDVTLERYPGRIQGGGHPGDGHQPRGLRVAHAASPVDEDQAALAAALLHQQIDGDLGGVVGIVGFLEEVEGAPREHDADDGLAAAGARHAAQRAVGVGPAADQRAVADPPRPLADHAARRGGRRYRPVAIQRDRADRTPAALGEPRALTLGDQRGWIALRQPGGPREGVGALGDEQDVPAVVEYAPGERDGIRDAVHRGDGAAAEAVALHDRGVHLDGAGRGQHRAAPGVEDRVVFQHADRRLDGVERVTVLGQRAPAGQDRLPHPGAHLGGVGRIGAGATMDNQRGNPGDSLAPRSHDPTLSQHLSGAPAGHVTILGP